MGRVNMAASHRWFKWFLLYLHLIVVFEKAGFPKYRLKNCAQSEACFDIFWGSTRKDRLDYEGLCWFYSWDRRGWHHIGFDAGRAFCINSGIKLNTSLSLSFLLLSGDICPNPGPHNVLDPCGISMKSVKSNQCGICCDSCNTWFHVRWQCVNMRLESYRSHADNPDLQWICNVCLELPTNKSDTNISIDDSNLDPNLDLMQTEGGKGWIHSCQTMHKVKVV